MMPTFAEKSHVKPILFKKIERNKEELGTDDMYSIVSGMSYSYCPGTADDWTSKVLSFCDSVSYDYNDFSDSYEYKIN